MSYKNCKQVVNHHLRERSHTPQFDHHELCQLNENNDIEHTGSHVMLWLVLKIYLIVQIRRCKKKIANKYSLMACRSTTATDCSHRLQPQSHYHATYRGGCWMYLWNWLVGPQQSQTEGTDLSPCYLFWWKYLCRWLVGPHRYRLQLQSHHHATYPSGSTCESGLSVHDSHRLKAQSYLHSTYPGGSICECGLSVHDSHRLKAQSYNHTTYSDGSICEVACHCYSYSSIFLYCELDFSRSPMFVVGSLQRHPHCPTPHTCKNYVRKRTYN